MGYRIALQRRGLINQVGDDADKHVGLQRAALHHHSSCFCMGGQSPFTVGGTSYRSLPTRDIDAARPT